MVSLGGLLVPQGSHDLMFLGKHQQCGGFVDIVNVISSRAELLLALASTVKSKGPNEDVCPKKKR